MDLSIIIVNWNSVKFLDACIASVRHETSGLDYEIVVIDSASFDGCASLLRERHPAVRFIQSERNLGFGRANNQAFAQSLGASVLFLNPDTEVVGPAVVTMHRWLQRLPDAGAVGCRLLNTDGSIQTSCIQSFPSVVNQVLDGEWLRQRWPTARLWGTRALYAADTGPHTVEAIAGACVMIKRELFERVGGFSTDYFMYAEDIDLCHKTQALGLKNYYLADATVVHHGGGSSQEAPSDFAVILMRESILRFLAKTRGRTHAGLYRIAMLTVAGVRLALLAASRLALARPENAAARLASERKWRAVLKWCLFRRSAVEHFDPIARDSNAAWRT